MAYTTVDRIRASTGFLNEDNISDETIEEAIAEADRTIDGYVKIVYTLPFASTPSEIALISYEIATAILYSSEYGEESQDTDKGWYKRLEWAMDQLAKIQKKEIKLIDENGDEYARNRASTISYAPNAETSAVGQADYPRVTMTKQF